MLWPSFKPPVGCPCGQTAPVDAQLDGAQGQARLARQRGTNTAPRPLQYRANAAQWSGIFHWSPVEYEIQRSTGAKRPIYFIFRAKNLEKSRTGANRGEERQDRAKGSRAPARALGWPHGDEP